MMPGLITVTEAAQLKGVTRSVIDRAIDRAIERGDLRAQMVLGRKALQREEVSEGENTRSSKNPLAETKAREKLTSYL